MNKNLENVQIFHILLTTPPMPLIFFNRKCCIELATCLRKLDISTILSSRIGIFLKITPNFLKVENLNACSTAPAIF